MGVFGNLGIDSGADSFIGLNNNDGYSAAIFTANATGTIDSLHVSIDSNIFANNLQLAIYDSSGNLLDDTGPITFATGDVSGAVSVAITSGNDYTIVVIGDGAYNVDFDSGGTSLERNDTGDYASFPDDPLPSQTFASGSQPLIWAESSGPDITSITDPLKTDSEGTATGTDFEAVQGTGTIDQTIGAVTIEVSAYGTWSDTSVPFTSVDIESDDDGAGNQLRYGTHVAELTNDSGESATIPFEATPATDNDFVDLVAPLATSGDRITAVGDLAADDQLRYQALLQQGGSPTIFTVVVNSDGTFSVDGATPDGTYTFEVRALDDSDDTWGTAANQTVIIGDVAGGGVGITNKLIIGITAGI